MKMSTRIFNAIALIVAPVSAWAGIVTTSVPEPNIVTLVALGGIVVVLISRSRKK